MNSADAAAVLGLSLIALVAMLLSILLIFVAISDEWAYGRRRWWFMGTLSLGLTALAHWIYNAIIVIGMVWGRL